MRGSEIRMPRIELPITPEVSVEQQRENAEHMLHTAGDIARTMRSSIEAQAEAAPVYRRDAAVFFDNVENGEKPSRYYNIDEPGLWLQEIVAAIIQKRKTVVSLPGFNMTTCRDENGNYTVEPVDYSHNPLACSIGGIMRAIRPPHHEMLINYPVADLFDPATGRPFSEKARKDFHADADTYIRAQHVLLPSDKQGVDYNLTSLSRSEQLFSSRLLPRLKESEWGSIKDMRHGTINFHPQDELLDIVPGKLDDKKRERYKRNGITLKVFGETTADALSVAASVWHPRNREAVRLNILNQGSYISASNQFMLLRALDLTRIERFQTIHIPPEEFVPFKGMSQYALSRRIEMHTQKFMDSFDYDDFVSFDPVEYAMRNYGKNILTDDRNLCMLTMFALDMLNIKNANTVDIGCGPNLYPAMLLEPYSRTIDLLEYSPANRSFLDKWFNSKLPPEQQTIFNKFALLMLGGGGGHYHNVIPRLKEGWRNGRVSVAFGDSFSLPASRWDLITNSFVGDSILWQKLLFPNTVREMCEALTPEGVIFSAYMLNDPNHRGYPAGEGKKFPNISQSAGEIHDTYVDNGMDCVVIPTAGPEKFRNGYDGMAFVVAARQGSQMAQKVRQLQRPMHEFAQAGFGIPT